MLRIVAHPILGDAPQPRTVTIFYNGRPLPAHEGEPIAAALLANGIKALRFTEKKGEPRGIFCCIGRCSDCLVTVDGEQNIRSCVTPVREGMEIKSQG
ncbi:Hydrogen cyanide synthase subunit HcnA [Neomoorella glycerini]|uniref:Hydrogen cyanide synthase subunit HcnA n=1 Tax=Neomoorella glycerini TaxID=55779 RepID=A0A6I5ZWF7_9FIRM|nr:(2Fe-2S)-binding protein [Moorella glycerini]QGP93787.1 Hydrogen cyanide synthase subunit HcnA [Moorella glycerini]